MIEKSTKATGHSDLLERVYSVGRVSILESLSMAIQKVDQTQSEIQKWVTLDLLYAVWARAFNVKTCIKICRMGDLTEVNRKTLEDLHHFAEEERNAQARDVYVCLAGLYGSVIAV